MKRVANWKSGGIGRIASIGVIAATAAITSTVVSQMHEDAPSPEQVMEAWMSFGQPGPEHKKMADMAGTWTQQQTYWMIPGAPPEQSTSTATFKPMFDGRFMVEKMKSVMKTPDGQEMEFEGFGVFGYDNQKEKHFFVWFDSLSTSMMYGEGETDGNTITYLSEMNNPVTGDPMEYKTVVTTHSPDKTELIMYEGHDGHWHKHMLIESTRN